MPKTKLATAHKMDNSSAGVPQMPDIPEGMALIPVTEGQVGGVAGLVVDARSLHAALGVKRDFTTWIRGRIQEYEFSESESYDISDSPDLVNQNLDSPKKVNQDSSAHGGDRKSKKYTLTLDMAKELAMLEKNAMGRAVRRYFIQCEKNLLSSANTHTQAQQQTQGNPAPEIDARKASELLDCSGKPYEKNPEKRHLALLVWMLTEIPRKKAYEEYARTLKIVGDSNKNTAEKVAECAYRKFFRESEMEIINNPVFVLDLSKLKEHIEKELEK